MISITSSQAVPNSSIRTLIQPAAKAPQNLRLGGLRHGLPRIVPAGEIGDVAKSGAAQNAGRNRAAISAFAGSSATVYAKAG
jgi:hypothetical protein